MTSSLGVGVVRAREPIKRDQRRPKRGIRALSRGFATGFGRRRIEGHPAGEMYWHIIPITVPGLDFNDFTYRYLNNRYWTATAGDGFVFSYPEPQ